MRRVQSEHRDWQNKNFPFWKEWEVVLGVQEEAGELAHAFLKRHRGIKGTYPEHTEKIKDAVGDIAIFLMGVCTREGWVFEDVVRETWDEVKKREFETGGEE